MKKITVFMIFAAMLLSIFIAEDMQSAPNDSSGEIPENIYEQQYSNMAVRSPYDTPHLIWKDKAIPPAALSSEGDEVIFSYNNSGLWNGMKDVRTDGNFAYCALQYGLLILDISDITDPGFVSQVFMPEGDAWRIALDGGYAYVADGYGGLQIVDISDPAHPALIASLETPGYCYDVSVSGDYAFLADGAGGFLVIDITDRKNPHTLASVVLSGETVALDIEGNYAYVCHGNHGLTIIDISDMENPIEKGSLGEIGNLLDVEVGGNYAFLAAGARGILSVDISNPDEPFLASIRVSKAGALGIAIKDDFAYVTYGSTSGLQIFDISNPITPRHVSDILIPGTTLGISVSGDFAFVAGWYSGLHIIDIGSPTQSYKTGSYFTRGSIESVAANDQYLYIARSGWYIGDGSMQIIKANDDSIPVMISEVVLDGPAAMDVQVSGNYAFVTDVCNGLQVIDISDPYHPFVAGNLPLCGHSMKITLFGDMAYVANDSLGLVIIDVTRKDSPQLMGQFDNRGFISGLAADESYVYLADTRSGMQIVDVLNPGQPILRSTVATAGPAKDVEVDGNIAYLVDGSGELLIFDITDRQNPVMIQSLSDLKDPVHVEVDGIFAYVTDVFYGIKVYNISEPGNAYNAGSYPTPGYAWDVSIFDGRCIIADYYGLVSLGMQCPELAFEPGKIIFEGNQGGYQPDAQTFKIENIGAGSLSWKLSNSESWLNLAPSSGSGDSEIKAEPDITGLVEGIYYDTIVISSNAINTPEFLPVEFVVNAPNSSPVLEEVADQFVDENAGLSVTISARDEDGTTPKLLAENLPFNSSFDDNGDGSGLFEFNPDFTQAGEYRISFVAVDAVDSLLSDTAIMLVTVNNINRPPAFMTALNDQEVLEGEVIEMDIRASDPDGDPITITCTGKPENAEFTDMSNGTGSFLFEPDYRNVDSMYSVIFTASDNLGGTAGDTMEITVTNRQLEVIRVDPNPPASGVKDILISEPILIIFNEGIDESTLVGNFFAESEKGDDLEYDYNADLFQIIVTKPASWFSALDTIYITIDDGITDRSGIPLAEPVQRTILTGPVVYSGDTDNDGMVDERDILPLGLHWQSTGPVRSDASGCEWGISPAHQWDPLPATYADADGSGIIDADDICGIAQNWELSHAEKTSAENNDADLVTALKQVDESILREMYDGLLNCTESRGREALLKILGEMIEENNAPLPSLVELDQNFPNPFNPITTISYSLEKRRSVEIDIYNLSGQLVKRLESGVKDAGTYSITWDGTDNTNAPASSGIYFYRLTTGNQTITKKMLLLK